MSEVGRIAVIGNRDFCAPFKILGLSVLTPGNPDEARALLAQVVEEKYAICLIQETWLEVLKPEVAEPATGSPRSVSAFPTSGPARNR